MTPVGETTPEFLALADATGLITANQARIAEALGNHDHSYRRRRQWAAYRLRRLVDAGVIVPAPGEGWLNPRTGRRTNAYRLRRAYFAPIRDEALEVTEKLADYANSSRLAWPSWETLARDLGKTPAQVGRALWAAARAGWIRRIGRRWSLVASWLHPREGEPIKSARLAAVAAASIAVAALSAERYDSTAAGDHLAGLHTYREDCVRCAPPF